MQNPIALFKDWHAAARASGMQEPNAMTLATATPKGVPSARIVLLKEVSDRGFVFYTNSTSRKGHELLGNPHASLLFYWMPLQRQVRVEGKVEKVSDAESDLYFSTRGRESQIGAWASEQSSVLLNRELLTARLDQIRLKYDGKDVPRPPHWHGFRIVPEIIEFWEEAPSRLHHRRRFTHTYDGWQLDLLNP